MRLGFILGFLIGGAIAALLNAEEAEAPDDAQLLSGGGARPASTHPVMDTLKEQWREAREAGQEAAAEKEAEMLQEYERTVHRKQENE